MSKELKELIETVDIANQAHTELEMAIRFLKEEVQRLNSKVAEQKNIIRTQQVKISNYGEPKLPDDVMILKDIIVSQREEISMKDDELELLKRKIHGLNKKIEAVEDRNLRYYEPLIAQEQGGDIFKPNDIPAIQYNIEDYNGWTNIVNFHSWYLLPLPPNYYFQLISNNLLNTFELSPGVVYNENEKATSFFVNASYAGYYPIFDVYTQYGNRASTYTDVNNKTHSYSWKEHAVTLGIRLPFDLII